MGEINVVPYIDVMLVLLVIFMVTAPMLSQGIKVDLPKARAEPIQPDKLEPLVLSIERDGRMYLNIGDPNAPLTARSGAGSCLRRDAAGNPSAPCWSRQIRPSLTVASWRAWCCCSSQARRRSASSPSRWPPRRARARSAER